METSEPLSSIVKVIGLKEEGRKNKERKEKGRNKIINNRTKRNSNQT
jgi:hypothetical protein